MDTMKILVMFASELDIPAKEGHAAFHATSIEYFFFGENGELVQPKLLVDDTVGMRRGKSNLDPEMIKKISYIPGIYEGTFEMSMGSKGVPTLKLNDLNFVGQVAITLKPEKEVK